MSRPITLLILTLLLIPCCAPPKRNLNQKSEVRALTSQKELMWFLATVADPSFALANAKKMDPASLTEEDYSLFIDTGRRIPWGANSLLAGGFNGDQVYRRLAEQLRQNGRDLHHAAHRKQGENAVKGTLALRQTCKSCHAKFK